MGSPESRKHGGPDVLVNSQDSGVSGRELLHPSVSPEVQRLPFLSAGREVRVLRHMGAARRTQGGRLVQIARGLLLLMP